MGEGSSGRPRGATILSAPEVQAWAAAMAEGMHAGATELEGEVSSVTYYFLRW